VFDGVAIVCGTPHTAKGGAVLQDHGSYSTAWRRYKLWSLAFWIGFAAYLPMLAFVNRVFAGNSVGAGNIIFAAAFVWMMIWCAIGYQKFNFRCPRCGELFFNKFDDRPWRMVWRHNPFARHCVHCGPPKWAAQDPNPHAAG
jgi:hypothetical protein